MVYPKYKTQDIAFCEFIVNDDTYALFDPDDKLVVVLKRHEYLSQPQLKRLGNSHGRYRKSRSPLRGRAARQPGGTIPQRAKSFTITFVSYPFESNCSVEDAGIRAGEIIAHRCWWLSSEDRLHSVYITGCEWKPNIPMIGNVSSGYGVHGFKEKYMLDAYANSVWIHTSPAVMFSNGLERLVYGSISMWGEIVEHERGYRAEFAKIISLDTTNLSLRKKYGL